MLIALLFGCTDVLRTPTGNEVQRGGLWFDSLTNVTTAQTSGSLVLIANSPLPCDPPDTADNPDTVEDEAAAAIIYWQGQIADAFAREGAFVVIAVLLSHDGTGEAEYAMQDDTVNNAAAALSTSDHAGWGSWLQIQEAELVETDGFFYSYTPTLVQYDLAVPPPSTVMVERTDDVEMSGTFDFSPDHISGSFTAAHCENAALYNQLVQYSGSLAALATGGVQ